MGLDSVDHFPGTAQAQQYLATDDGVWTLDLVVDGLAQVVQQAGLLDDGLLLGSAAHLRGHGAAEARHLLGVTEDVLTVAGPEAKAAQQPQQVWVGFLDADLEEGL